LFYLFIYFFFIVIEILFVCIVLPISTPLVVSFSW